MLLIPSIAEEINRIWIINEDLIDQVSARDRLYSWALLILILWVNRINTSHCETQTETETVFSLYRSSFLILGKFKLLVQQVFFGTQISINFMVLKLNAFFSYYQREKKITTFIFNSLILFSAFYWIAPGEKIMSLARILLSTMGLYGMRLNAKAPTLLDPWNKYVQCP